MVNFFTFKNSYFGVVVGSHFCKMNMKIASLYSKVLFNEYNAYMLCLLFKLEILYVSTAEYYIHECQ